MSVDDGHYRPTYNDIHKLIGNSAKKIRDEFKPDLFVAIGGGGFYPARVMRTFCKTPGRKNIPIQAIGLSLYEEMGTEDSTQEKLGKEIVRTQWLDFSTLGKMSLLGRRILIVDEVDDTRTTLAYAISELQQDLEKQLAALPEEKRKTIPKTEFAIFVVHNKLKEKAASLPSDIMYFSGEDLGDVWVDYPWEMLDIDKHEELAAAQKKLRAEQQS
ncbi:PRTase-like protein [Cystobasidium minutum MCA 4210]|uniref:PRTase-like protein n=1 Tax=Cystobasidium minutum MCA 4210 TaxID=1397322 RepID=UPI0034CFDEB2|eukprot:jgi/Rhomi1/212593/estExt_Genemark1.C_70083